MRSDFKARGVNQSEPDRIALSSGSALWGFNRAKDRSEDHVFYL